MPYGEEYNFDEGKSAKFNAGVLQTERINEILKTLNFCKINPMAFNSDYIDWNFNIQLRCIYSLYLEIDSYMKKEEGKKCIQIYEKIEELIEKYPLLEEKRQFNKPVEKIPNQTNWKILKKAFDNFERTVKKYGVKYQILSATIDEDLEGL